MKKQTTGKIFEDLVKTNAPNITSSLAEKDIVLMLAHAKYFLCDFVFEDKSAIHIERTASGIGVNAMDNIEVNEDEKQALSRTD